MATKGEIKSLYTDMTETTAIFPRTKVKAITDDNGVGLNAILEDVAYVGPQTGLTATSPVNAESLGGRPAEDYATNDFVTNKIAEAQMSGAGNGDIDLSGYATKTDLAGLVKKSGDTINGHLILARNDGYSGIQMNDAAGNMAALVQITGASHQLGLHQYATDTSYRESYYPPAPATGLTANKTYSLLTTKTGVGISFGGTGATNAADARKNLGMHVPTYHTFAQLGLTTACTTAEVFKAMPSPSILVFQQIPANTLRVTDFPNNHHGVLELSRVGNYGLARTYTVSSTNGATFYSYEASFYFNSSDSTVASTGWKRTDTDTTYGSATTSAAGLMSAADKTKLDGITTSADSVSFSRSLTSGTKVGTITINGAATDIYAPKDTNTTYTLAKSGSTIQLKSGSTVVSSITDSTGSGGGGWTKLTKTTLLGEYYDQVGLENVSVSTYIDWYYRSADGIGELIGVPQSRTFIDCLAAWGNGAYESQLYTVPLPSGVSFTGLPYLNISATNAYAWLMSEGSVIQNGIIKAYFCRPTNSATDVTDYYINFHIVGKV